MKTAYGCEFRWSECQIELGTAPDEPYDHTSDKSIWINETEFPVDREYWVRLLQDDGRATPHNSFDMIDYLIEFHSDGLLRLKQYGPNNDKFYIVSAQEATGCKYTDMDVVDDTMGDIMVLFQQRLEPPQLHVIED